MLSPLSCFSRTCKAFLIFQGLSSPLLPKWDFRKYCKFFEGMQLGGKQYHASHPRRGPKPGLEIKINFFKVSGEEGWQAVKDEQVPFLTADILFSVI